MKKWVVLLSIVMIFSMLMAACATGEQGEQGEGALQTAAPGLEITGLATEGAGDLVTTPAGTAVEITGTAAPTAVASAVATIASPTEAAPTAASTAAPTGEGETDQPRGAEILPSTGRVDVTKLSTLLTYQVVDQSGNVIGKVDDLIVNTCEAHILFLVVNPDASLNIENNNLILIPFETVTLSQGVIDVDKKSIQINANASDLADVPSFGRDAIDLNAVDWATEAMGYWSAHGPLQLTTECRVAGQSVDSASGTPEAYATATLSGDTAGATTTEVRKITFARALLKADLQEGTGQSLGKVEEVILEPESGLLRYLAVRLTGNTQAGPGLVAVPFRAVNLDETTGSADSAVMVLLVETDILNNAPVFNALPDVNNSQWETEALNYWDQYVPLTEDDQQ